MVENRRKKNTRFLFWKKLEEIPKEHQELVRQMRGFGYGIKNKENLFEGVLQFCKEKGRVPAQVKKKAIEQNNEEKRENSLYRKWLLSDEKRIIDNYIGKK